MFADSPERRHHTYSARPLSLGIPAICIGTCEGSGAHTREEYLEKASLIPGRMVATDLVLGYCSDNDLP